MDYKYNNNKYYRLIDNLNKIVCYGYLDFRSILSTNHKVEWISEEEYINYKNV